MSTPATYRDELRRLVVLALPLAIAQAGQALMGVVDVAVLGRAGPVLLGGTGIGNTLFFGIAILGMGVMHGLDPLISQALGAGDPGRARRLLWQGVWLAALLSVALAIPIAAAPALLRPIGVEPAVAREAVRFLGWRLVGLPFFLVFFAPRSYLQASGRLRPLLVGVVLANLINLGLDVLLVFGGGGLPTWTGPLRALPPLGVVGSAWATNLASMAQVAVLAFSVRALPAASAAPRRRLAPPDWQELRQVVRVGLPAGLHMFAEVSFFGLVSLLAGRLGTLPLAAHQVALQYASLTFTAAVGLGNGGSVRVGLAVGAGDRAGARRAGVAALFAASCFMATNGLLLLLFPGAVARLLTDDPGVIATAVPLLRIAALFQLSDGLQGVGAGILRGVGETHYTFLANMFAYWVVGLPLLILLGFGLGMGVAGMWLGFVVSLTVVAAALVHRFLRISSREIVPLAARTEG